MRRLPGRFSAAFRLLGVMFHAFAMVLHPLTAMLHVLAMLLEVFPTLFESLAGPLVAVFSQRLAALLQLLPAVLEMLPTLLEVLSVLFHVLSGALLGFRMILQPLRILFDVFAKLRMLFEPLGIPLGGLTAGPQTIGFGLDTRRLLHPLTLRGRFVLRLGLRGVFGRGD